MTFWRLDIRKPKLKWVCVGLVLPSLIGMTFWSYFDLRLVHVLQGHTGWVRAMTFTPDGKWLISADEKGGFSSGIRRKGSCITS